jgi:starch synthase
MSKKKLLIVTQELDPYTALSEIATLVSKLPQYAQDKGGFELRILMPRYGTINERRHRLHEVVRLSGMNIIIDDDDYPLIIKVASLPSSRLQVYFLDNEDYFKRKSVFEDDEGKPFDDNYERMVFFSKSALEIVKKFGWAPDIIHVHGWMTSLVPLFVKTVYQNEPIFKHSKVVYSLYNSSGLNVVPADFEAKAGINNMDQSLLATYTEDGKFTEHKGAMHYADAIIKGSETFDENVLAVIPTDKPVLDFHAEETYLPSYIDFYKTLLTAAAEEEK